VVFQYVFEFIILLEGNFFVGSVLMTLLAAWGADISESFWEKNSSKLLLKKVQKMIRTRTSGMALFGSFSGIEKRQLFKVT